MLMNVLVVLGFPFVIALIITATGYVVAPIAIVVSIFSAVKMIKNRKLDYGTIFMNGYIWGWVGVALYLFFMLHSEYGDYLVSMHNNKCVPHRHPEGLSIYRNCIQDKFDVIALWAYLSKEIILVFAVVALVVGLFGSDRNN